MVASVVPVARSIYLCDRCVPLPGGKVTLEGLFNAITPASYPYVHRSFSVFAQLSGGVGQVSLFIDILYAPQRRLIYTTNTRQLSFPRMDFTLQFAEQIQGCPFDQSGMYLVEMYCNNVFIGDVPLHLR
jgi:hypothetical protein